jgi:metal-dependent amidase/aminoacylase/carboxypeptidase family protein
MTNIDDLLQELQSIYTNIPTHPELPGAAGTLRWRSGVITSTSDSLHVILFGRGAHSSMPRASIDPVVMAAATVMRLQTIVSREIAQSESAVVTIGSLHAGTTENVIPDEAILTLNIRTFDERVRKHVLSAIERIIKAEGAASGAPKDSRNNSFHELLRCN